MDVLQKFTPVSLYTLESRAALLSRREKKYLFHRADLFPVLSSFLSNFYILTIEGKNVFTYDTIWFDTSDFACYLEHHNGKALRKKVRTRLYVDTNRAFFEVKLKRSFKVSKQRMQILPQQHGTLPEEGLSFFLKHCTRMHDIFASSTLFPVLRVNYKRITLVDYQYQERVTFDYDISWASLGSEGNSQYYTQPNMVVAEVKSLSNRSCASDVLHELKYRPVDAFSKYSVGLCLLEVAPKMNEFKQLVKKVRAF